MAAGLPGLLDSLGNRLYMRWPDTDAGTQFREYTSDDGPSPKMAFAVDNARITRTLLVSGAAVDWKAAKQNFLGRCYVTKTATTRTIHRDIPHSFPFESWLYATSIPEMEQGSFDQTDSDVAVYKQLKMQVVYTALTYNVLPDSSVLNTEVGHALEGRPDEGFALASGWENSRNITKTIKPSAKLYSLARGAMQIVGADLASGTAKPLLEGLPIVEPSAEVQYIWHNVPAGSSAAGEAGLGVPWNLHLTALGKLNNATFDRFPAGTLRLESIDPIAGRDAIGNRVYNVTYRMQFLPRVGHLTGQNQDGSQDTYYGHNYVYTLDSTGNNLIVARVTSNGLATGTPPYRSLDFRRLFNPDQP